MKKVFLTLAACVLIITGCSNNDVVESIDQNGGKLTFNTAIGKQTKVAELMNDGLQAAANSELNGIALWAYQETSTPGVYKKWFEDNLWYDASNWKVASTRFRNTAKTKYITYFPKGNVSLAANSFSDATFTAGSYPQFTYTIQSTQEDLVAGVTEIEANKTDIVVGLRHILSQINFGVKGYQGAQITINNITVHGVFNNATYTFGGANTYPIGVWSAWDPTTADYSYAVRGIGAVPVNANTGDVYIFGDGGNYGPGKTANVWYPVGAGNDWVEGNDANFPAVKMDNSLMLMPQAFNNASAANKDAYVTFEYTIRDIDGAYVAGNATTAETGTFKLDFSAENASAYASEWKQNMRYVYIIDFTDFLNDNKLSFKVDVETYPWENYDVAGGNTGIVGVPVLGQPTESSVDRITNGQKMYAATASTTLPSKDYQILTHETWHWDVYQFAGLNSGESFELDFDKVIFNGKNVIINVSSDYEIYIGAEVDQQTVTVTSPTQIVTIKKK